MHRISNHGLEVHKMYVNMRTKNLIGLLVLAVMLLKGTCVYAQKVLIDSVYYTLDGATKTAEIAVQSTSTAVGEVVINDSVTYEGVNYAVSKMADGAFAECNQLTSITLPQTLRNLGQYAFLRCTNLTSCIIPDSTITEIPFEAFWKAGLIEFRVPEGVTYIEQRSFEQMPNLQRVHLANSVQSVSSWAFYILDALQDPIYNDSLFVLMPRSYSGAYTIPSSIKVICNSAFYGCTKVTSLTIPEGVERIESLSLFFSLNSMVKTLHIPSTVNYIGPNAICSGWLETVTVAADNQHYTTWNGLVCTKDMKTLVYCPDRKYVYTTLPESIEHIAPYAFYVASYLHKLEMPNVKTIGRYAFVQNSLESLTLPACLEEIGNEAFSESYDLTSVTIPASVTSIGEEVFSGSRKLSKAVINNAIIGKGQFYNATGLETIEIGTNLREIRAYAFQQCQKLWYVRMPEANDYFRSIDGVLFSADTTALALYPPKHDGKIITLPEQTTTLRSGSLRGIDKDKLVLSRQTALLENEVFGGYFWGNDVTPVLDTIVAPMMAVPATQGNPFNLLNQGQTVLLVPCDSLAAIYRANNTWKGFAIQVDSTLLDQSDKKSEVATQTDDHSVQFTWPAVEGASYYTLIIWANEERTEKICTLTFNNMGQLVEINFSKHAPARLANNAAGSFSFRYNGLDENTHYWYTMGAYDVQNTELFQTSGSFATAGAGTPTGVEEGPSDQGLRTKVVINGQIYLMYEGRMYDVRGNQIK